MLGFAFLRYPSVRRLGGRRVPLPFRIPVRAFRLRAAPVAVLPAPAPAAAPLARPTPPTLLLRVRTPAGVSPVLVRCNATSSRSPKDEAKEEKGKEKEKESLKSKFERAWSTPTKWYPIPIALGALVLVAVQARKMRVAEPEVTSQRDGGAVIKPAIDGPWQVRIFAALPLRSMSQLWGYLNSLVLPVWFRPFGFKLYARIFGCNLDECTPEDLTKYESLGEFFYRELKPGMRPIADAPLVSPSDGKVLHCGEIVGEKVEQVKGITYSLEALLGTESQAHSAPANIDRQASSTAVGGEAVTVVDDENFARINDIPYSLSSLMGKDEATEFKEHRSGSDSDEEHDASMVDKTDFAHDAHVAARLGMTAMSTATDSSSNFGMVRPNHKLMFIVIYLAPGDYHRFHSPCAWVVERRRHFTGDLFSVSPYIAHRMRNLFVLNERVALLGRWKSGFFSMVPVGATNVGSIRINFDSTLRTNTVKRTHPAHTFTEAVYSHASVLKGQPLLPGEEMGGFRLGSTIVLVFEAPKDFQFTVKPGEKVRVGQALGEEKAESE